MIRKWVLTGLASVAGATAVSTPAAIALISASIALLGLLAVLVTVLCWVAVYGSREHSLRATRVLILLTGRAKDVTNEAAEGGDAGFSS